MALLIRSPNIWTKFGDQKVTLISDFEDLKDVLPARDSKEKALKLYLGSKK